MRGNTEWQRVVEDKGICLDNFIIAGDLNAVPGTVLWSIMRTCKHVVSGANNHTEKLCVWLIIINAA